MPTGKTVGTAANSAGKPRYALTEEGEGVGVEAVGVDADVAGSSLLVAVVGE